MPNMENAVIRLGNYFYKRRYLLYLLPAVILLANYRNLYYPFGSYFSDEVFEFLCFLVVSAGGGIRLWASGSSARSFRKKDGKLSVSFQPTGVFTIVRNPFFAGDFLIVAGLSLLLVEPWLIAISMGLFLAVYTPILISREKLLTLKYGASYKDYARRVHLFIPTLRPRPQESGHFRFALAMGKEGLWVGLAGLVFIGLEQLREISVLGSWNHNPLWFIVGIPFFGLYLICCSLDNGTQRFSNINAPEWPE